MSISTGKQVNVGKAESGFTLIELSIVLVIIGLIVGGILTGQDLIKAAEQRATIAQIEKYNTAVNTFRSKYGFIPGDMPWAAVNSFNLNPGGASGTLLVAGSGANGDGQLLGAGTDGAYFLGEPVLFWEEIGIAGLIDGSFGSAATSAGAMAADATSAALANNYMPTAKLGRANSINVVSGNSINYFMISGFGGGTITAATGKYAAQQNNLNPLELYSMDKKVDDGLPASGSWVAFNAASSASDSIITALVITTPAGTVGAVGTNNCVVTANASYQYTIISPQCSARIKFN